MTPNLQEMLTSDTISCRRLPSWDLSFGDDLRTILGDDYALLVGESEETESESEQQPPEDPQEVYEDAKQRIADGIAALNKMMAAQGHPVLDGLAKFGLLGLTDGEHVTLTKALLTYRGAQGNGRGAAGKQVQAAVDTYRKRLTQKVFAGLDDNPFGIEVGFTTTLDSALQRIAASVA
jgi:hypothetical protein